MAEDWNEVGLEVLGDLADEALEGELADKELGGLLVLADLAESDGTIVAVGFLTPPVAGADLRAALVASCLRGGLASGGLGRSAWRAMVLVLKIWRARRRTSSF